MVFFLKKNILIKLFLLIIILFLIVLIIPEILYNLFPLEYTDIIIQCAKKYELDPMLVIAIIKVESKFDAEAVSKRGAKGLMQLMPETASWISTQTNIDYMEGYLLEPKFNINFGCWYLNNLKKHFNDEIPVILAAYNGGRGNVKRWLDNGIWDGKFKNVDNIPFNETKSFIKKVYFNYALYGFLYKDKKKVF